MGPNTVQQATLETSAPEHMRWRQKRDGDMPIESDRCVRCGTGELQRAGVPRFGRVSVAIGATMVVIFGIGTMLSLLCATGGNWTTPDIMEMWRALAWVCGLLTIAGVVPLAARRTVLRCSNGNCRAIQFQ